MDIFHLITWCTLAYIAIRAVMILIGLGLYLFTEWEDEGLEVAPQDAWLRQPFYQPGDHWGCACVVAPFIPNYGSEYVLDV